MKSHGTRIGIDLRAIETGHRFRGIGEVVRRVFPGICEIVEASGTETSLVCFISDRQTKDLWPFVEKMNVSVEWVCIEPSNRLSKKHTPIQYLRQVWSEVRGNANEINVFNCDVLLQFDYHFGVSRKTKTLLFHYDLIPLIYSDHYFSERSSTKGTSKAKFLRRLRRATARAHTIVTISEHSKEDLIKYLKVDASKIDVNYLGCDRGDFQPVPSTPPTTQTAIPDSPFLLFIGGVDPLRRTVEDLVVAFNELRQKVPTLALVLVGNNFAKLDDLPSPNLKQAIQTSPHRDSIHLLGFVSDAERDLMYQRALAFVFPSHYEGFGLPILEAMQQRCPVVTYRNSSITEVGGEYVSYADGSEGIVNQVMRWREYEDSVKQERLSVAHAWSSKFTWAHTCERLYATLLRIGTS